MLKLGFLGTKILMKVTVELDEAVLAELLVATNERKKGPAVSKAVGEFLRRKKAGEFGRLLMEGAFDYPLTNDEVEKQGW